MQREITKFSRKTEEFVDSYVIDFPIEEMKHLFDIGDDDQMIACYEIKKQKQIEFFRNKGIPITKRSDFFVECFQFKKYTTVER